MNQQAKDMTIFNNVKKDIEQQVGDGFQLILPEHIDTDKFTMSVVTAIQRSPDLANANRPSLYMACMEAAEDGLIPNGKEAALVVYSTNIGTKQQPEYIKKVQYIPMIGGLRKRAYESSQITKWTINVVKEKDSFDYALGDDEYIKHKPALTGRGKTIGAYSIAKLKSGEKLYEFMDIQELEKVRSRSKNATKAVWNFNEDEMYRKTIGHRAFKSFPKHPSLDALASVMNQWEEQFVNDDEPVDHHDEKVIVDEVPDDDALAEEIEGDYIAAGENESDALIAKIKSCNDKDVLHDLLREVNKISDFKEKKTVHGVWMEKKEELDKAA